MIFLCVFSIPLAWIMDVFQQWIISLNGGAKSVIGAVIGACMGFDMGGPVNKTASMAANALGADGINGPMCAKIIGGMTPPIGLFIATMIKKNKFTRTELETAKTALPMGLCFITEGVLPFAAADPARFIPSSMAGSAVAGAIAVDVYKRQHPGCHDVPDCSGRTVKGLEAASDRKGCKSRGKGGNAGMNLLNLILSTDFVDVYKRQLGCHVVKYVYKMRRKDLMKK